MARKPGAQESNDVASNQNIKKRDRRRDIIEAARKILAEKGSAALSLRQVADRVGIRLASLQYHIPTKADLINALVDDVRNCYNAPLREITDSKEDDPETILANVIRWIKSPKDPEWGLVNKLEVQLWAMAYIDPEVAEAENKFYRIYRRFLAQLIHNINPKLNLEVAIQRGALMSVMIDGCSIILSEHRSSDPELDGLIDELVETSLELAKRPPSPAA